MVNLEQYAFYRYEKLESIELPRSLRKIGKGTFRECRKLRYIVIPEKVGILGEGVFFQCVKLEHIELPRSLRKIGKETFRDCKSLRAIKILEGVELIDESAFEGCGKLEHIELPKSLTKIGAEVFSQCKLLRVIKIPDGVEYIGRAAFMECEKLERIELSIRLKQIEDYAFDNCTELRVIKAPDGVEDIGLCAFSDCSKLMVAYIPQRVQLGEDICLGVSDDFVRYTDNEEYKALPVVADVDRRGHELNNRPIVCITKQPYFRFSNLEKGLAIFPGAREILRTLLLVQNRKQTESPGSFPPEILLYILEFLKWSEMHYRLDRSINDELLDSGDVKNSIFSSSISMKSLKVYVLTHSEDDS